MTTTITATPATATTMVAGLFDIITKLGSMGLTRRLEDWLVAVARSAAATAGKRLSKAVAAALYYSDRGTEWPNRQE